MGNAPQAKNGIFIKTFGGFDVFVNGRLIYFSSSKAKEMLAVMVEKGGSSVSLSQMTYLLYEDIPEETAKNSLRVIYHRLKNTLEENGAGQILIKERGSYAVDREQFTCDLYGFINGNPDDICTFSGSFMPDYIWAEGTLPYLKKLYQKYTGEMSR
ncbi:MAG: hypothetical protein Q4F29_06135 [Lachnospiraceae bacterium]|nr:hypothetical protein [Lachnospiraceae bacterium]